MKKIIYTLAFVLSFVGVVNAETLVVIDENGVVTKQIITSSDNGGNSPAVTVIRESSKDNNSYYYDRYTTQNAVLAGISSAVIGGLIYDGFRHNHKYYKYRPSKIHTPKPLNKKPHLVKRTNNKPQFVKPTNHKLGKRK